MSVGPCVSLPVSHSCFYEVKLSEQRVSDVQNRRRKNNLVCVTKNLLARHILSECRLPLELTCSVLRSVVLWRLLWHVTEKFLLFTTVPTLNVSSFLEHTCPGLCWVCSILEVCSVLTNFSPAYSPLWTVMLSAHWPDHEFSWEADHAGGDPHPWSGAQYRGQRTGEHAFASCLQMLHQKPALQRSFNILQVFFSSPLVLWYVQTYRHIRED